MGEASRHGATETLDAVERELREFFDLDDLATRFRKMNGAEPIDILACEKERDFPHQPAGFNATFYKRPDSTNGGVSVTPVARFDTIHEGLSYQTFRKCEEFQSQAGNVAIRGVRAVALAALQRRTAVGPIIAPGHAYTVSAAITAQQLNNNRADHLGVQSFPTPAMAHSLVNELSRNGIELFATRDSLETAIGASRVQARKQPNSVLVDPREDPTLIAGQATALFEYFAQLKSLGIDTRRHRVNLRIPVEQGTTFIGAAVVWRWLKEQDMLDSKSHLIAVQADRNDAVARTLEGAKPLSLESNHPHQLDLKAYPTGARKVSRRIMSVIEDWADDIQIVPPEYLVRACAMGIHPTRPLAGLAEVLTQGAVLMDAEEGRLDQSIPELTFTKGYGPRQAFLAEAVEPYTTHDDTSISQAANLIVQAIKERHEARRQDLASRSPQKRPDSTTPRPAQHKTSQTKATPPASLPRASESYARGLRVWRGPR